MKFVKLITVPVPAVPREAPVPSLMVVNLSNDGYFLPPAPIETELQLLDFLDGVLDGSVEV